MRDLIASLIHYLDVAYSQYYKFSPDIAVSIAQFNSDMGMAIHKGREFLRKLGPRRNQQKLVALPEGWELIAAVYGSGGDDYLATVLCYSGTDNKWVTWTANFDTNCEGVSHGHYFESFNYPNDFEQMAKDAWDDFVKRAGRMATMAQVWADEGSFPIRTRDHEPQVWCATCCKFMPASHDLQHRE